MQLGFAVVPLQLNQSLVWEFCPCSDEEQQPREVNCQSLKLSG